MLGEIAITADKYDLIHIFWPWAESWLGVCRKLHRRDAGEWSGELMWAAWAFGDEKLLLREVDMAVRSTFVDHEEHHEGLEREVNDTQDRDSVEREANDAGGYELRIMDMYYNHVSLYDPGQNEILGLLGIGMYVRVLASSQSSF